MQKKAQCRLLVEKLQLGEKDADYAEVPGGVVCVPGDFATRAQNNSK